MKNFEKKAKKLMNTIPKDKIVKVVEIFFPHAKVYLFGSRAKGTNRESSDIDIAIDAGQPIGMTEKGQINSMLDALNIPQKIDLIDFHRVPESLKDSILREGVMWKS